MNGSVNPFDCNPISGECNCKLGVVGPQCDECAEGYYASGDNNQTYECVGKFLLKIFTISLPFPLTIINIH